MPPRHGNGPGWGGPASGSKPRGDKKPPFEPGNVAAAGPHDMHTNDAKRAFMIGIYETIAADVTAPPIARITAADKWLDRHEGKAKTPLQHSGPGDGPMQFVIYGQPEAESTEAWQQDYPPPA